MGAGGKKKEHDPKYYTNFDFFYKRTCFRSMALFYKTQFKPFQDKWLTKRKGNFSVMPALEEFAASYLPVYEEIRDDEAKNKFLEYLKLLVFSHRHNKNDAYLKDTIEALTLCAILCTSIANLQKSY